MTHTYQLTGMTCNGCKASVEKSLQKLSGITNVQANVEKEEVAIDMEKQHSIKELQAILADKFTIALTEPDKSSLKTKAETETKSKLQQLKPLFLILFYITTASILLHIDNWNTIAAMLDFMGLFYIVFSFFKMLDLKGFPASFQMYDPLAKLIPTYGKIYPFIEATLGIMFLMRFQISIALILTIVILSITTIGVVKTLMSKKSIRCACLGTALNLPMTEATFIENAIMLIMAVVLLSRMIL